MGQKNELITINGRMTNVIMRADCLNTIRLLGAIQVLYGHALSHLKIEAIPVVGDFINFFYGVPIFFTMSGFLIWGSCGRSLSYGDYLKKRFWRIYPELWVAVAIEMIVMFALYSGPYNWPQTILFVFTQSSIFQFWTPECLRGYGCGTPNGALWTIGVIVQFYLVAYFLYKWLHAKNVKSWLVGGILPSLLLGVLSPLLINYLPETVGKLYGQTLFPFIWMFVIPCCIAEKKEKILPVLKKYWWVFLILVLTRKYLVRIEIDATYGIIHTLLLFLSLTGIAYVLPQLNIKTDISYAIYIYHMIVINAFIALGVMHSQWLMLIVLLLTCLLAWLSTVTIGKYSLSQKYK